VSKRATLAAAAASAVAAAKGGQLSALPGVETERRKEGTMQIRMVRFWQMAQVWTLSKEGLLHLLIRSRASTFYTVAERQCLPRKE
jgi:hypothetical protein